METSLPEIVFASNNPHKLEDARAILAGKAKVLSLAEIVCHDDIPETADTLAGNAMIKARWVNAKYGVDCFADDTGLMVDSLDGAPGVYSARFAGEHCSPDDNMALLLEKLKNEKNRKAKFVTVVALILGNEEFLFNGEVTGKIAEKHSGTAGFGYDPIFIPEGFDISFAEMTSTRKNSISHRGRAMAQLANFIESL